MEDFSSIIFTAKYNRLSIKLWLPPYPQYRLLLDKQGVLEKSEDLPEIVLSWEFRIDFETAKAFRKSGGNYLRAKQWEDLTVEVRISWCE